MVGRPAAAAGGGGLILGDRQAQGACWDKHQEVHTSTCTSIPKATDTYVRYLLQARRARL
jgi:hypothetical protein